MSNAASGTLGAASAGVGAAAGAAAAGDGAGGGAGRACAATASVTSVRMTAPSLTRSPTLTFRSATFPPSGEGTSIEALSDSSVTSGCSAAMVSPGLTMTSMIGTSLKSPMSGTRTSATPAGALVGAGGADTAGFTVSLAGPAPSTSSMRIGAPSLTLSPTLTASDLTTPAAGEGTSIDALSDSSVIRGASASTCWPGCTAISMIGTSWKSPRSGTRISLNSPIALPLPTYAGCALHLLVLLPSSHIFQGGGRSGSIPYLVTAASTLLLGMAPSCASALSAAVAT